MLNTFRPMAIQDHRPPIPSTDALQNVLGKNAQVHVSMSPLFAKTRDLSHRTSSLLIMITYKSRRLPIS